MAGLCWPQVLGWTCWGWAVSPRLPALLGYREDLLISGSYLSRVHGILPCPPPGHWCLKAHPTHLHPVAFGFDLNVISGFGFAV